MHDGGMVRHAALGKFSSSGAASLALAVAVGGSALAGPAQEPPSTQALMRPADIARLPRPAADHELAYGKDPNQMGELRLPPGTGPHPVVVLVHGGCWLPQAPRYLAGIGEELKETASRPGTSSTAVSAKPAVVGPAPISTSVTPSTTSARLPRAITSVSTARRCSVTRLVATWPCGPPSGIDSRGRIPCTWPTRCRFGRSSTWLAPSICPPILNTWRRCAAVLSSRT